MNGQASGVLVGSRFRQRVAQLMSGFWFIPMLLTVISLGLAALLLRLDLDFDVAVWAERTPVLFSKSEGARSLLATIAGSTISVTGVLFSVTILVLSSAARQFGPGLLRNFMRHRGTQVVLGAFVGTFAYSLLVLRFIGGEREFVPHVAINVGLLLGLASFFLLIYFIHHVAEFIQVSRVIDDVAEKLEDTLRDSFPQRDPHRDDSPDEEARHELLDRMDHEGGVLMATGAGHLQVVDYSRLCEIAREHGLAIQVMPQLGDFVIPGAALVRILPADRVDDELVRDVKSCLMLGNQRSEAQDPEYAVHQLVEIAVRALSPGVNDPFTALNCLDRLAGALALLVTRQLPSRYVHDERGELRVIANPLTYASIVEAAFNQIRQLADGHVAVVLRMLEIIAQLARRDIPDAFRRALQGQLEAMQAHYAKRFTNDLDRQDFDARLENAREALR